MFFFQISISISLFTDLCDAEIYKLNNIILF